MLEHDQRERFVAAALAYCGTPYHAGGMLKGVGVDCATLLICAARDARLTIGAGVAEISDAGQFFQGVNNNASSVPYYSPVWHLHRGGQRYLNILLQCCAEVGPPPRRGDILLWQFGRSFSHAGIAIDWPQLIHARIGHKCCIVNADNAVWLQRSGVKERPMKVLSFWGRR